MSSDNPRPYRAKDQASGKEAADAVAAVLQHAAARDEAASVKPTAKKQPKWMLPVGINLCVLAIYLLIAPPNWVVLDPIEEVPPVELASGMGTAMFLQVQRIEAYRQTNGRLPVVLADAGTPTEGVVYTIVDPDRYTLSASAGGQTLSYDSSDPASLGALMSGDALQKIQGGG